MLRTPPRCYLVSRTTDCAVLPVFSIFAVLAGRGGTSSLLVGAQGRSVVAARMGTHASGGGSDPLWTELVSATTSVKENGRALVIQQNTR